MDDIETIMRTSPVIPVLVLDDPATAVAIGTALVRGGLRVLEVTLRTPRALEVMTAMTGKASGSAQQANNPFTGGRRRF